MRAGLLWALAGALALLGLWEREAQQPSAAVAPEVTRSDPAGLLRAQPPQAGVAASGRWTAPLSPQGLSLRERQRELLQGRVELARQALQRYQDYARYPHESRPASEHADQLQPFAPVEEEHPFRSPGGTEMQGVRLLTSQERQFASGMESSRVSLSLRDAQGQALPLRVTRSVLREVTPPGQTARSAEWALPLLDAGHSGDLQAGDGVHSALMQPALQGFADFAGSVRLEVWLEYGGQPGFVYFDLAYSPLSAASWLPGVGEAVVDGSLALDLGLKVLIPGRYVISARVDDANGRALALLQFNQELGVGEQRARLWVHGRLLHDLKPAFPLRLRDIDAFLLLPDTFPDRVTLPRRIGLQHQTRAYALASFSGAGWNSEESQRYLAELGRDLEQAEQQLRRLGPTPP